MGNTPEQNGRINIYGGASLRNTILAAQEKEKEVNEKSESIPEKSQYVDLNAGYQVPKQVYFKEENKTDEDKDNHKSSVDKSLRELILEGIEKR